MSSGRSDEGDSEASPEGPRAVRFGSTLHSHTRQLIVTALRTAVKLSPLTQNEIARRLYTTPKHLSQSLNGRSAMSLEMMDAMFGVLGLEVIVTVRPRAGGATDGPRSAVHERGREARAETSRRAARGLAARTGTGRRERRPQATAQVEPGGTNPGHRS